MVKVWYPKPEHFAQFYGSSGLYEFQYLCHPASVTALEWRSVSQVRSSGFAMEIPNPNRFNSFVLTPTVTHTFHRIYRLS